EQALAALRAAVARDPANARARLLLSRLLLDTNHPNDALASYRIFLQRFPDAPGARTAKRRVEELEKVLARQ
ncbi:MAG: tetratricopeptide repeat protein, partial [Deltaproteobacteria bacterium]|nr:tetratricopeptide repeat protein [Deltaproteobacteria bacterium]